MTADAQAGPVARGDEAEGGELRGAAGPQPGPAGPAGASPAVAEGAVVGSALERDDVAVHVQRLDQWQHEVVVQGARQQAGGRVVRRGHQDRARVGHGAPSDRAVQIHPPRRHHRRGARSAAPRFASRSATGCCAGSSTDPSAVAASPSPSRSAPRAVTPRTKPQVRAPSPVRGPSHDAATWGPNRKQEAVPVPPTAVLEVLSGPGCSPTSVDPVNVTAGARRGGVLMATPPQLPVPRSRSRLFIQVSPGLRSVAVSCLNRHWA